MYTQIITIILLAGIGATSNAASNRDCEMRPDKCNQGKAVRLMMEKEQIYPYTWFAHHSNGCTLTPGKIKQLEKINFVPKVDPTVDPNLRMP